MTGVWSMTLGIGSLIASSIAKYSILPNVSSNYNQQSSLLLQHNILILISVLIVLTLSINLIRNTQFLKKDYTMT